MKDKLHHGICPKCYSYWPRAAAMIRHKQCHKRSIRNIRPSFIEFRNDSASDNDQESDNLPEELVDNDEFSDSDHFHEELPR